MTGEECRAKGDDVCAMTLLGSIDSVNTKTGERLERQLYQCATCGRRVDDTGVVHNEGAAP